MVETRTLHGDRMTRYVQIGAYIYDLEDGTLSERPQFCFNDGERTRMIYAAEKLLQDLGNMISAPQVVYPIGPAMTKKINETKEEVVHL